MKLYYRALEIATIYHSNQFRKNGITPYIIHPIRVADKFTDETDKIIAILHDTIEDTNIDPQLILDTFGQNIFDIINILTHNRGENYFDYINRIKQNIVATRIKIQDILDNLNDSPSKNQTERYNIALKVLLN